MKHSRDLYRFVSCVSCVACVVDASASTLVAPGVAPESRPLVALGDLS